MQILQDNETAATFTDAANQRQEAVNTLMYDQASGVAESRASLQESACGVPAVVTCTGTTCTVLNCWAMVCWAASAQPQPAKPQAAGQQLHSQILHSHDLYGYSLLADTQAKQAVVGSAAKWHLCSA